jgi:hypothetical protein
MAQDFRHRMWKFTELAKKIRQYAKNTQRKQEKFIKNDKIVIYLCRIKKILWGKYSLLKNTFPTGRKK